MNCHLHPDREATAYCRTCGRPLCADDQRDIYGVVYCQDCLARSLSRSAVPAPAAVPEPGAPTPGLALLLGFIPGVGAIYNCQYLKAFVQVVVFAFLIAMSNNDVAEPFVGIAIAAFYFYMVIDSFRTAKRMQAGLPVDDLFNLGSSEIQAPMAAIVLIGIGVIFLLRSLGFFFYNFSRFFWPVLLIAVGVYLLLRHRGVRLS